MADLFSKISICFIIGAISALDTTSLETSTTIITTTNSSSDMNMTHSISVSLPTELPIEPPIPSHRLRKVIVPVVVVCSIVIIAIVLGLLLRRYRQKIKSKQDIGTGLQEVRHKPEVVEDPAAHAKLLSQKPKVESDDEECYLVPEPHPNGTTSIVVEEVQTPDGSEIDIDYVGPRIGDETDETYVNIHLPTSVYENMSSTQNSSVGSSDDEYYNIVSSAR
ncbi:uncharacterized protein [Watersipora subatra]|uniref:uncharacterized protein n=1 Tax=Watersipora subatra TaxID=2589382 RepID=UPI00355B663A